MARGKPWTGEEIKVLREMAEQRLSAQEIYESGKLPNRTCEAIRKQLNLDFLVATIRRGMVETIEPVWNRILLFKQFAVLLFNKLSQRKMLCVWRRLLSFSAWRLSRSVGCKKLVSLCFRGRFRSSGILQEAPSLSRNICYLRKTDRRSSWEENALKIAVIRFFPASLHLAS